MNGQTDRNTNVCDVWARQHQLEIEMKNTEAKTEEAAVLLHFVTKYKTYIHHSAIAYEFF